VKNVYATVGLNIVRSDLRYTDIRKLLHEWGLFHEAQEVVWVVTYDPITTLRSVVEVARGNQFEVEVDVSNVMQAVWASGTNRFQLMHNHPSGNVQPTELDLTLTNQVNLSAAMGSMFLEDHIIIGPPDQWYSMVKAGVFEPSPKIKQLTAVRGPAVWLHKEER